MMKKAIKGWAVILAVALSVSGCGVLKPIQREPGSQDKRQEKLSVPRVYLDFDDILVPKTMRVNRKMSSVFETAATTAGVLSLEGTLSLDVLIEFFESNMGKDNWTLVSKFKGPRSILHFEKGNRWCMITLSDRRYAAKAQVEIWVTPKGETPAAGLLN